MANNVPTPIKGPGVTISQEFQTETPAQAGFLFFPVVVGPLYEIVQALNDDGSANADAKYGTYVQFPEVVTQDDFPSPRGNITQVDVDGSTIRPYLYFNSVMAGYDTKRGYGSAFLKAMNLARKATLFSAAIPTAGAAVDGKVSVFSFDNPTPEYTGGDVIIQYSAATPGGMVTATSMAEQINDAVGEEVAFVLDQATYPTILAYLGIGAGNECLAIVSPTYGASGSVMARAGSTANPVLGFAYDVAAEKNQRVEGSGFKGWDDGDSDTLTPWIHYHRGAYYEWSGSWPTSPVDIDPATGGVTQDAKPGWFIDEVTVEDDQYTGFYAPAVTFGPTGTLDLRKYDYMFADGVQVKNGKVMKVEPTRFRMGVTDVIASVIGSDGRYSSEALSAVEVETLYAQIPFAPRKAWFRANYLDYQANVPLNDPAYLLGNVSGDPAEPAEVSGSAVHGPYSIIGMNMRTQVVKDDVEEDEQTIIFTGGPFTDMGDVATFLNDFRLVDAVATVEDVGATYTSAADICFNRLTFTSDANPANPDIIDGDTVTVDGVVYEFDNNAVIVAGHVKVTIVVGAGNKGAAMTALAAVMATTQPTYTFTAGTGPGPALDPYVRVYPPADATVTTATTAANAAWDNPASLDDTEHLTLTVDGVDYAITNASGVPATPIALGANVAELVETLGSNDVAVYLAAGMTNTLYNKFLFTANDKKLVITSLGAGIGEGKDLTFSVSTAGVPIRFGIVASAAAYGTSKLHIATTSYGSKQQMTVGLGTANVRLGFSPTSATVGTGKDVEFTEKLMITEATADIDWAAVKNLDYDDPAGTFVADGRDLILNWWNGTGAENVYKFIPTDPRAAGYLTKAELLVTLNTAANWRPLTSIAASVLTFTGAAVNTQTVRIGTVTYEFNDGSGPVTPPHVLVDVSGSLLAPAACAALASAIQLHQPELNVVYTAGASLLSFTGYATTAETCANAAWSGGPVWAGAPAGLPVVFSFDGEKLVVTGATGYFHCCDYFEFESSPAYGSLWATPLKLTTGVRFSGREELAASRLRWKMNDNPKIYEVTASSNTMPDLITSIEDDLGQAMGFAGDTYPASDDAEKFALISFLAGVASKVEAYVSDESTLISGTDPDQIAARVLGFVTYVVPPAGSTSSPYAYLTSCTDGTGRPDPDFYVEDATGSLVVGAEILRRKDTGYPYSQGTSGSSPLYIQYKGLRLDVSPMANNPGLMSYTDPTAMEDSIGPISEDNPLALGYYYMLIASGGIPVYGLGVSDVSPAEPMGTQLAYQKCFTFLEAKDVYAIVPLTTSEFVYGLLKQHIDKMSLPDNKSERIGYICPTVLTRAFPTVIAAGTGGSSQETLVNTFTCDESPVAGLIDLGIDPDLPIPAADEIYLEVSVETATIAEIRRYLVSAVNNVLVSVTTTFPVDPDNPFNPDSFYCEEDLELDLANVTWSMKKRGAKLVIPGSSPELPDYQAISENVAMDGASYAFRRLFYAFPDTGVSSPNGVLANLPSYYLACTIAGTRCFVRPDQPLSYVALNGWSTVVGSNDRMTEGQLDQVAGGGIMVLIQNGAAGPVVIRDEFTTDVSSIETRTGSITTAVDAVAKFFRNSLKPKVGPSNITANYLDDLSTMAQGLCALVSGPNGWVKSCTVNSIVVSETDPTAIFIDLSITVFYPARTINVRLLI